MGGGGMRVKTGGGGGVRGLRQGGGVRGLRQVSLSEIFIIACCTTYTVNCRHHFIHQTLLSDINFVHELIENTAY